MTDSVIHAQTCKIMRGGFDKELVEWHLVDVDLVWGDPGVAHTRLP